MRPDVPVEAQRLEEPEALGAGSRQPAGPHAAREERAFPVRPGAPALPARQRAAGSAARHRAERAMPPGLPALGRQELPRAAGDQLAAEHPWARAIRKSAFLP
jgi:hypothetical protein